MVRPTKPENGTKLETSSNETQAARLESNAEVSELCSRNGGQKAYTGAPPGNTAPSNCTKPKESTKILRSGVDSLYVSYRGTIHEEIEETLEKSKMLARSDDEQFNAGAFLNLNEHCFEVKGWGSKKYAFVIQDNWFHLKIASSNAKNIPMIHAQVGSEILTRSGLSPAVNALNAVAMQIGNKTSDSTVGRVDLCVDFITTVDIQNIPRISWVGRSNKFHPYYLGEYLTGITFGQGGPIMARLYNKLLQSRLKKIDFLYPIWKEAGWNDDQAVWRLEFQIKSQVLRQFNIQTVLDLRRKLPGLWAYCMHSWLKLKIPSATDDTQTRWPLHPLWKTLAKVSWEGTTSEPLYRSHKDRAPSDEYFFVQGIAAITSFMAKHNIDSFDEAIEKFRLQAHDYHLLRSRLTGKTLPTYAREKAELKACKYNTAKKQEEA